MSGMDKLSSFLLGEYVEKKAQVMDASTIEMNSFCGKVKKRGICEKVHCYMVMVQPTIVPIIMPEKADETTKMKAS